MPSAVMMFAAGLGTRMGDLTRDRPKPLIEVAGRPLFDHAFELTKAITPETVVVNTYYKPEMMAEALRPYNVRISNESPQALETGGGLKHALPLLGSEPVFTMNTDAIWSGPNPLQLLAEAWDPSKMDALLICVPGTQALGHAGPGDFFLDQDSRVSRGGSLVYGGIQIIKTDRLNDISEQVFSLNLVWDLMREENRLFGLPYPGQWCDVGTPEGIPLAETLLDPADV